jgi:hypothetical protein
MQKIDQSVFDKASVQTRLLFFIDLGFFLSMQIRGKYASQSVHEDAELRAINESAHRIFQCLRGLAKNDISRIPEEVIIQMLLDIASEGNLQEELLWAIAEAEKAHKLT